MEPVDNGRFSVTGDSSMGSAGEKTGGAMVESSGLCSVEGTKTGLSISVGAWVISAGAKPVTGSG
jgi:hypothetical protein